MDGFRDQLVQPDGQTDAYFILETRARVVHKGLQGDALSKRLNELGIGNPKLAKPQEQRGLWR